MLKTILYFCPVQKVPCGVGINKKIFMKLKKIELQFIFLNVK